MNLRIQASSVAASVLALCLPACSEPVTATALPAIELPTPRLVVDQFGYLPDAEKIAIVRSPRVGFDAAVPQKLTGDYDVVNTETHQVIFSAAATPWHAGQVDPLSGDRVAHIDFSAVTTPGIYRITARETGETSADFVISDTVYDDVFRQAFRVMYYQRAGYAKQPPYADPCWADTASHLGAGQDREARLHSDKKNARTARDVSGGWYDAGDYNKYTNWTADYIKTLLLAYEARPSVWGDDFNIPESGNGLPDVLDEVKWGLDSLIRLQNEDGSVLSIVGLANGSPPSAATGPSFYGPANTSATLTTAAAFANAAAIYGALGHSDLESYAQDLAARASRAWQWAEDNPDIVFKNNDPTQKSEGLGAGQQEVDDKGRAIKRLEAAVYLFTLTGDDEYRNVIDALAPQSLMVQGNYVSGYETASQQALLRYAGHPDATPSVKESIKEAWELSRIEAARDDAYLAGVIAVNWGSNSIISRRGSMYLEGTRRPTPRERNNASHHLHYIHGVNPLGKVYLTNMGDFGAENSVDRLYHSWFRNGSATWGSVSESTYGPLPGILVGGPNQYYEWESCCPNKCGSRESNAMCGLTPPAPPAGQPPLKSYRDMSAGWPLKSWEITENSNGYQTAYLYLLSQFVSESTNE